MNRSTLDKAIAEAKRFIELAKQVETDTTYGGEKRSEWTQPGRKAAAAKRASLDLTNALAAMRKP